MNDPWIEHAVRVINETYGDIVSVEDKGKDLLKFGATDNADSGEKTTIATFGSVGTPNVNETFSTTNDIDAIVSSDDDDDGVITIEGHVIDSSGNFAFKVQDVTLDGNTPASLSIPLARCTRMFVKDGSFSEPANDLSGDVYAYASDGVTVTDGVPQTNAAVKARIVAGNNQTEKASTSISAKDYWIITQAQISGAKGNSSTVTGDGDIEVRNVGGVFRPTGLQLVVRAGGSQVASVDFRPCLIVPPNSDVRLMINSNTDNASFSGFLNGVLAKVI